MKELKIIPISGGLDSTYLLYHYLKDTNYDIHAHHIILKSKFEPRWEEELEACKNIVKYCKEIRDFNYTESVWDFPYHCWDAEIVAFCAGQIANKIAKKYTRISMLSGRIKDDNDVQSSVSRLHYRHSIWRSSSAPVKSKINPKVELPIINMTKVDILKNLPEELSEMCWSCRHSDNGEPCGRCKACNDVKKAKEQLDHDMLVNKLTNE